MEVKNCRGCGRLYNYIGCGYLLCPACMDELDKKFGEVKKYIQDNPRATMPQISEAMDVSIQQIERWVREERLTFADDSPIGIECESCGVTIKSGRYCAACKDQLQKGLGNMYREEKPQIDRNKLRRDSTNRMRFLDR